MAKCRYCGADIGSDSTCPYCGNTVAEAKRLDEERNERINKRASFIDDLFFLPSNIHELDTARLEKLYDDLLDKYNRSCAELSEEQDKKAQDNIEAVNELLPLQEEISRLKDIIKQYESSGQTTPRVKTSTGLVNFLIKECNPPQIYCAAYILRSECDRCLQERYHYKYGYNKNLKKYVFEKPFLRMFLEITKDKGVIKKLDEMRTLTNKFVHKSVLNDNEIRVKIGDKNAVMVYLNTLLNTLIKYKLID